MAMIKDAFRLNFDLFLAFLVELLWLNHSYLDGCSGFFLLQERSPGLVQSWRS